MSKKIINNNMFESSLVHVGAYFRFTGIRKILIVIIHLSERTLSGDDERVEAIPYRCMAYYVSSYDMW